jgi:hypothetical protein|tara:strand:- start:5144 stop:6121 length:978 start_codon:yes stop_codon:yes gene_type:complete
MLIREDYQGCYNDPVEKHYDFQRFSEDDGQKVLFHGIGCLENPRHKAALKHYKKKAFYNLEHPCAWYGSYEYMSKSANMDGYFDKVFTICPYSAKWLNEVQQRNTFVPASIPFNKNYLVSEKEDKVHDVMYWGGIHHPTHVNFVDSMRRFNYNFLSLGWQHWAAPFRTRQFVQEYAPSITHQNVPRAEMWSLIRKTKINVMANLLYLSESQVEIIKSIEGWSKNEAFAHLDQRILPQYKTRPIECAANRSLMLVKRDPWNINELWFSPDSEFLYFDKDEDLPDMIEEISSNWEKYEHIAENAFKRATQDYTVEGFVQAVERGLDD